MKSEPELLLICARILLRTKQKKAPLPSACPATRSGCCRGPSLAISVLPGAFNCRKQLQWVCSHTSHQREDPAPQPSFPTAGWFWGPTSFSRESSFSQLPLPFCRVTVATTFYLRKRKSVCFSWRRPLAHWTLRATADSPLRSLSQPQLPELSKHCLSHSRFPRVSPSD